MFANIVRRTRLISSSHLSRDFSDHRVTLRASTVHSTSTPISIQKIIQSYFNDTVEENKKKLFAPVEYTSNIPQQNIIKKFLYGLNHWMELPAERLQFLEDITYMTYIAFAMADDVADDSELRKSFPTAQTIYGCTKAWLAANALIISAIQRLAATGNSKAVQVLCRNMIHLYGGVSRREEQKGNVSCPSSEMYMNGILGEIGSFVSSVFDVMQSYSECKKDFTTLAALVSLYFQIQNDNRNLSRKQEANDQVFAEDITSGIYNYPIVLAAETCSPEAEIVLNIVRSRTKNSAVKSYCIDLIENLGAMKKSAEFETELYSLILNEIENLGGNPKFKDCIDVMHQWKIEEIYPGHPEYKSE